MTPNPAEGFPDWVFDSAFPFSFAWDSAHRITRCGRSLARFLPDPCAGLAVTGLFGLNRPTGRLDAEWLNSHPETLMLIEVLGTDLMLRGHVMAASPAGPWLFAGSPWIKSPDDLDALGLNLGDFAPHDPTVDMLYVVQSQRAGNRDLRELNDRLNEQNNFGDFLMQLAISFVNMLPEKIDGEINRALAMTGMYTKVDRAYLMRYDFGDRTVANTHEWCAEGIVPMIHELQCVPMEGLEEGWLDIHLRGETVHVPSVQDLPASGALRQLLEPQGITTLVAVPLNYRKQCLGFVGFDSVRHHIVWSNEQLTLVRMLAEIFTNAEMSRRRTKAIHEQRTKHKRMSLLLRKAVEATGVAVWELKRNATTVNMIYGWDRLFGVEWDGKTVELEEFRSRVHPESQRGVEAVISGLDGYGTKPKNLEFRLRGKRGEWRYLSAWWIEETGGSDDQVKLYGGTMDVSDTHLRSEAQSLLNRISSRFVDLESFENAVSASMAEISEFCLARGAELFPLNGGPQTASDDASDRPLGNRGSLGKNGNLPDAASGLGRRLSSGDCVVTGEDGSVKSLRDTPAEEVPFPPGSVLWVPLMVGGDTKAAIAVADPGFGIQTGAPHLDFLRGCAEVIAGALGRADAERTLLESGKRKQVILNSLKEAIFLTDAKGRVTIVNRAGADFCGRSVASIIGRPVSESLVSVIPSSVGFFPADFAGLGDKEQTMVCYSENGRQARALQLARRLLVDDQANITGMLGMITDITEQQAWENNLISQKIQAELSSKEKSLYISSLSHELRTPMHGVLGMLELMIKSGSLDRANEAFARSARRSGNDLLRLFDDLLQIAKLECGVVKIDAREVDIGDMMNETIMPFREECEKLGIALDLHISGNVPGKMTVDDLRLRQIINNLVSNAIKYTDAGFVKVAVGLEECAADRPAAGKKTIVFSVHDSGIGIAEQDMEHLFTPFFKINADRSRSVEGSGLGLLITRELVKLLNGEMRIESELGVGTRAVVSLPLSGAADRPSEREGNQPAGKAWEGLAGLGILIAEDNDINRMLLTEHLSAMGCVVSSAENGMQAVRAAEQHAYDVVIMDLSMPVMDGYDAAKKIMASSGAKGGGPVIIGCTADASDFAASRCLEAGMRSVIVKPFTRDELAAAIHSIMGGGRRRSETYPVPEPAARADSSVPVFNESVFRSLEDNIARDKLNTILDLFRDDSMRKIRDLAGAIEECDAARCRATAHALKGGAASVGAERLSHYSSLIEQACKQHGMDPNVKNLVPEGMVEKMLAAQADFLRHVGLRLETQQGT